MKSLVEFLGIEEAGLAEEALLRRLSPPLPGTGPGTDVAQSNALLVSFFKQAEAAGGAVLAASATCILNLIEALMGERALGDGSALGEALGKLAPTDRVPIALRAIRILEDAKVALDPIALNAFVQRLHPAAAPHMTYWHVVLARFAQEVLRDEEILISAQAVVCEQFLAEPIERLARTRPLLFVNRIVPILFEALTLHELKEVEVCKVLRRTLPAAFRELEHSKQVTDARIHSTMRVLACHLQELTAADRCKEVAHTVMEAATTAHGELQLHLSSRPSRALASRNLAIIETGISQGRARAAAHWLERRKPQLEDVLTSYTRRVRAKLKSTRGTRVDPVLTTNLLPFSEGIYFLIWREILQRSGVMLSLREQPWGEVLPALLHEQLSFAIYNHVVPRGRQYRSVGMRVTVKPLLVYTGYPLVIRREVAERLCKSLPPRESGLLQSVLASGKALSFEEFKTCQTLRERLRAHERIGFIPNSDIQEAAREALGDIPDHEMVLGADEAVEQLVDSRIAAAFVGAVQASYLRRRFNASIVTLTNVPQETPVHLWFKSKTYGNRNYNRLVPVLLEAWRVTCRIWNEARKPSAESDMLLRRWIESLAGELNLDSQRTGTPRTPISSWRELAELHAAHDNLYCPGQTKAVYVDDGTRNLILYKATKTLQHEVESARKELPAPVNKTFH
jgi:hypothetical protein